MRVVVLMAALLVSGCGGQATREGAPVSEVAPAASGPAATGTMAKLDGTDWRFVEVAGAVVPARVSATMRFRRGRVSGKAGCNTYGARYRVAADGSVSFSQVLSTKMACLAPAGAMAVEQRIFAALPGVAAVKLRNGDLVFLDAAGRSLARLEPAGKS